MLKFFQKYQRYIFGVVAVVITISFSFFGTYGSFTGPSDREVTAFVTAGGEAITRSELEQMAAFIQTDLDDKRFYGPVWGPNFLNDGVIRKDFLENGLGLMLMQAYPEYFEQDLKSKAQKEAFYTPYTHPQAPYISAEGAWRYFAPGLKGALDRLQQGGEPLSDDMLGARMALYLNQKAFPSPYLAQVLRQQEAQYDWVKKDPAINPRELQLFGYQTIDEWFGPRFTRAVAEFIFNAAEVAQAKGYKVSREEAWADLLVNGAESYQEMSKYPEVGAMSEGKYIGEQLKRMGFDKMRAVDVWQKVLLFRRMFHDIANGTLVAPDIFKDYSRWASESVTGKTYNLPLPLRFSGLLDLAELEVYLNATAASNQGIKLADKPKSVSDVQKTTPELVEKRARVKVKLADKKELEAKVPLRDILEWQEKEENFAKLKKAFPDLGVSDAKTAEERMDALDKLSDRQRLKVDQYARSEIVAANRDWAKSALEASPEKESVISVRMKGGKDPLMGVKDRMAFMKALESAKKGQPFAFVGDDVLYQIEVLDLSPDWELVTFEDARENGSLGELLTKKLEAYYPEAKEKEGKKFKNASGAYKPLSEVKREVAELWLQPKLDQIKQAVEKELQSSSGPLLISETLPGYRFISWASEAKNAKDKSPYIAEAVPPQEETSKLPYKNSWNNQFKWRVTERVFPRKNGGDSTLKTEKLFSLNEGEVSDLLTPANGDIQFVEVEKKSSAPDMKRVDEAIINLRQLIGNETQRSYMKSLLQEIKEKNGISFN